MGPLDRSIDSINRASGQDRGAKNSNESVKKNAADATVVDLTD